MGRSSSFSMAGIWRSSRGNDSFCSLDANFCYCFGEYICRDDAQPSYPPRHIFLRFVTVNDMLQKISLKLMMIPFSKFFLYSLNGFRVFF